MTLKRWAAAPCWINTTPTRWRYAHWLIKRLTWRNLKGLCLMAAGVPGEGREPEPRRSEDDWRHSEWKQPLLHLSDRDAVHSVRHQRQHRVRSASSFSVIIFGSEGWLIIETISGFGWRFPALLLLFWCYCRSNVQNNLIKPSDLPPFSSMWW